MQEVLVNRLGGLSLPRKSVVRLTDCPYMTLDVYCGHKTTTHQQQLKKEFEIAVVKEPLVIEPLRFYCNCFILTEVKHHLIAELPYFFDYKTEFFPSKIIPKI